MSIDQKAAMTIRTAGETPAARADRITGKRFAAVLLAGLTLVFISSVFFEPSKVQPNGEYFTICAFKHFTGLPCPGCGLTHSFCALGRGHLMDGFAFNLLGPPLFAAAILLWFRNAFFLFDWDRPVIFLDRLAERLNAVKLFLLAFLVFGVARLLYLLVDTPSLLTRGILFRVLTGSVE